MSNKKFRACHSCKPDIQQLEVIKETVNTVKFIRVSGREDRENKVSSYNSWHNTKDEAKVEIISRLQTKVDQLEREVQRYKEMIKEAQKL